MKGLYIHIPFCSSICSYCDFPKMVGSKVNQEIYINKLIEEINSKRELLSSITSVYFGGGTPNSIENNLLEKLFISIRDILANSIENSIECNPELLSLEQIKLFKKYNINRVSLGVETTNEEAIQLINRHHNKKIIFDSIKLLVNNGIYNINTDLIIGIPNTSLDTVKEDLDFLLVLPITHISCYTLILEERTLLSHQINNNIITLLDDDTVADMYLYSKDRIINSGFTHYEISNFAKPGFLSIHNMLYWNEEEYIGCGMGASSFINNQRITNYRTLKKYLDYRVEEVIDIDLEDRKKEIFLLGLRKIKGVNIKEFKDKYNEDPIIKYNLDKWIDNGFLIFEDNYIRISDDKLLLGNIIFEEFV